MGARTRLALLAGLGLTVADCRARSDGATPTQHVAPMVSFEGVPMREHAEDVVGYTLSAKLDAGAHTVHGEGTIVWRNTSRVPVRELYFHLYLNAFKNERTAFLRAPVASGRGTGPVDDWGYIDVHKLVAREFDNVDLWPGRDQTSPGDPEDETDIRVPLPKEIAPGATLTLDVAWDDKLPSIVVRTGYARGFHMVGQWFPKVARLEPDGRWAHFPFFHLSEFYADFGTYDVTLDVPEGQVVGATGTRTEETHADHRTILRYQQADVHDFAWTAWDRFQEMHAEAEGVAIRCLFPPGFERAAEREIATAKFGLARFGAAFGRYPYPVLTLVHPPENAAEAGGMEYPTLITTGGPFWETPLVHPLEAVTLHEFGHQYFYGLIATNEHQWPLLDEGLNSYAESTGLATMLGPGSLLEVANLEVSDRAVQRNFAVQYGHDEPVAQAADAFASGRDYGALVYARTSTIMDTLSSVYGPEVVFRALGVYARRFRFLHPNVHDFIDVVEEVAGEPAAHNLRVALFDRGWVDYVAKDASSHPKAAPLGLFDREGKRETMPPAPTGDAPWEGWALIERHGSLSFPVVIELRGEDGSVERVPWDGVGNWTRVPYHGSSELASVVVDPDVNVSLDENLSNNAFRQRRAQPSRTLERVTYFAELALYAIMP